MTKRNLIWTVTLLALAVILVLARRPVYTPSDSDEMQPLLRPLVETYHLIQDKGYHPNEDRDLIRGAAGGMAAAADEYSSYISPDRAENFQHRMDGKERGVGLHLEQVGRQIRAYQVVPGSPASRATVAIGDAVLTIDGQDVEGMTAAQAERLVNDGPSGTVVRLDLVGLDDKVRTVTLDRREFKVESVGGLLRRDDGRWSYLACTDPPIAYVRVREFVRDTVEEVQVALRQVDAPRGLVLDLRDNPGGQFSVAVEVADLFLREGPIVTLVDKSGKGAPYMARPVGSYPEELRLIVLVDSRTASAAEIVAGALAFNRRAVLVGTRTRGKAAIQGMFRLPDGMGEMNLTTAEFLLGEGRSIGRREGSSDWGVNPHVEMSLSSLEWRQLSRLRSRVEAGVSTRTAPATRRTGRRRATTAAAGISAALAPDTDEGALLSLDRQLRKAAELLADPEAFDAILQRPYPLTAPATGTAE